MITLKSPIAWLLIWSSFVTGLFMAYGIVTAREIWPVQLLASDTSRASAGK
jgi:hypothetical protein